MDDVDVILLDDVLDLPDSLLEGSNGSGAVNLEDVYSD
jgi:hypothetical protein